ncbi:odorant receptor 131-2-like [Engraulis encrasicolus]|uniref:odorant receptor 131-2-like n=1 Tax=Engraulis encrasicolus TaxID=184585 RepID=UPI002FD47471
MFVVLLSKPVFRESPRYVLFAHMLCNDSIQLFYSSIVIILFFTKIRTTKSACSFLVLVTSSTSINAPLNLGVMSLERYTAICFPLRHSQLATTRRAYVAIAAIWFFGLLNPVVNSLHKCVTDPHFFTEQVVCGTQAVLDVSPWQMLLYHALNGLYYVTVTLAIVFSYVNVVRVARSASSNDKSTGKAHRTLLLHLVQFVLCLNVLLYNSIARYLALVLSSGVYDDVSFAIFLLVILLPRCLNPLIYGLRDEAIRKLFMLNFTCDLSGGKSKINVKSI